MRKTSPGTVPPVCRCVNACWREGGLDYRTYLKRLANLPGDVPLMIEHLKTKEEYDQAHGHIQKVGREVNVVFEYMG